MTERSASSSDPAPAISRTFGSFHAEALIRRLDVDPLEYMVPERIAAFRKRGPSIDEQREFAQAQMAIFHEDRHLHDAFGTRAGISLFLMRMFILQEFTRTGLQLRHEKKRWPLPVTQGDGAALSGDVLKFVRLALAAKRAGRRFQATPAINQNLEEMPHPLPHVSQLQEDDLKSMVYAFPARTQAVRSDGSVHPGLLHIPLAFDAILEGNAQALQRDCVEMMWGAEVAHSLFTLSGATFRKIGEAGQPPTYNVTDLMVSRFVANAGQPKFPRAAVMKLSDHALSEAMVSVGWGPDGNVQTQLLCPGHAFVNMLKTVGPSAINAGDVPAPLDEGYKALRDQLANLPNWETLDACHPRPLSDVQILYHWVASNIIVPLLDERLKTGHRVFSDPQLWLERFPAMPKAPFRVDLDGVLKTDNVPERVQQAWLAVVMLDSMVRQLIGGEPAILCPRAHRLMPGLEKANLARTGSCDEYVSADLCGRYVAGMTIDSLPDCHFAWMLDLAGF
jgi:hypothetical protein